MVEKLRLSPNSSPRGITSPQVIVLHTTGGPSAESALSWFDQTKSGVSSHVVIDKDGTVYRVVPDDRVAWHAGVSKFDGHTDVNKISLGVEMVGLNVQTYPPAQLQACAQWCAEKCKFYGIALDHIVGHKDVALPVGRKSDPENFPWDTWRPMLAALVNGGQAQD